MNGRLQVGIVGLGMIGTDHLRRLTETVPDVDVVALCDSAVEKAEQAAADYAPDAAVYSDFHDLITDANVEAVVVTTHNEGHHDVVMAALDLEKYVFCEKPLGVTAAECEDVIEREQQLGRRLVQVGFMRRYAPEYVEMKQQIDAGTIGQPLMVHQRHYNPTQDAAFDTQHSIVETAIHEIDLDHWLVGDDYAAVSLTFPRQTRHVPSADIQDPLLLTIKTKTGIVITTEVFVRAQYGYEIHCEVIGEEGMLQLPTPPHVTVRRQNAKQTAISSDWKGRFERAYDLEFYDFVNHTKNRQSPAGPSAWDGYVAAVTADAFLKSLANDGAKQAVDLPETPAFYR